MQVKNGRLVLPDGTSYRVLVLPLQKTMRPELLQKIEQLVAAGAVILGSPPDRSPSLQDYPHADQAVQQLAQKLWGEGLEKQRRYVKGFVFNGVTLHEVFKALSIMPDFYCDNQSIQYTHRTLNGKEIYFLANATGNPIKFTATFRTTGLQPELWNALSGTTRLLPGFKNDSTTSTVPLELSANGSAFIVFEKNIGSTAPKVEVNFPKPTLVTGMNNPWQVRFESDPIKRGPGRTVVLNTLKDWTKVNDERIRYYSGKAVYNTFFMLKNISSEKSYYLDLGDVVATAKVKINGKYVGGVWAYPYKVNVGTALKNGTNTLEVEVINTWKNRIIGDRLVPMNKRLVYSRINPWNGDSVLQKSGLIGPVSLYEENY